MIVRGKEKTNDQMMTEYCYEKKAHNQQINEIAQKSQIRDTFDPTEMSMSLLRQQKQIVAQELRNKALCDEHECY